MNPHIPSTVLFTTRGTAILLHINYNQASKTPKPTTDANVSHLPHLQIQTLCYHSRNRLEI
jgi:hypothetical protein